MLCKLCIGLFFTLYEIALLLLSVLFIPSLFFTTCCLKCQLFICFITLFTYPLSLSYMDRAEWSMSLVLIYKFSMELWAKFGVLINNLASSVGNRFCLWFHWPFSGPYNSVCANLCNIVGSSLHQLSLHYNSNATSTLCLSSAIRQTKMDSFICKCGYCTTHADINSQLIRGALYRPVSRALDTAVTSCAACKRAEIRLLGFPENNY